MCQLEKDNFIFQQDNAPCHTSKYTKEYFKKKKINLMVWPPNSADLNPIENLWMVLKRKIHGKGITNKQSLVLTTINAWNELKNDPILKKLVNSMPKRVNEVIKANSGPIKY